MALNGASQRFRDDETTNEEDGLNSLDMGGNVYASEVGGLKVDVSPIRGLIDGTVVDYAGASEQSLTGSATNYLYLNSAGTLTKNTTGFPTWGDGSGEERYFPLAEVVCGVSTITSITDKRFKFYA